jgi:hypothetical protein
MADEDLTAISLGASSSIKYNPREMTLEERVQVLKKALRESR